MSFVYIELKQSSISQFSDDAILSLYKKRQPTQLPFLKNLNIDLTIQIHPFNLFRVHP